jgi:DNA adenine methylase
LKSQQIDTGIEAKPFLKWVGGKTQLLPELIARIPNEIERYFEPFIGGGAFFFYLQHGQLKMANSVRHPCPPKRATIVDINEELINIYKVIKQKPEELIEDLKKHIYNPEYYYQLRNIDRKLEYKFWSDVERASRLIYLNKTCFNGLY